MGVATEPQIDARYGDLERHFGAWEKIKDCIDQNIDVFENYRQSGHPGGSRSKVHMLVALTLGGFMRWDIRHPEKRFGDRFNFARFHLKLLARAVIELFGEKAVRAAHVAYRSHQNVQHGWLERPSQSQFSVSL